MRVSAKISVAVSSSARNWTDWRVAIETWVLRRSWLALCLLLVVATALHRVSLMYTPAPFIDEPWFASRAWELVNTGRAFGSLDSGIADRYDGYWLSLPITYAFVESLVLRALGLSLLSIRITSLIFGVVLLIAIFRVSATLYDARTGLVAVALVATSRSFLASAHLGRPDIMVSALGYTAVALQVTDRSKGFSPRAALAGIAVVAAFDAHLNGVLFGFALLALYIADSGAGIIRSGRFWSFAVGTALGLSAFVAFHILPYPDTYLSINRPGVIEWRPPPVLTWDVGYWLVAAFGTVWLLIWSSTAEAFLGIAGFLVLVALRKREHRHVLAIFGSLFVAVSLLLRYKMEFYGILISPALSLVVASFPAHAFRWKWVRSKIVILKRATIGGAVIGGLFLILQAMTTDPMADYRDALRVVRQTIPQGASVLGTQTYWLGAPENRYVAFEVLASWPRFFPGSTVEDALRELHPDYILIDSHVDLFMVNDRGELSEYTQFLFVPRREVDAFLDRQAQLAATFESNVFGKVRIYRVNWGSTP